MSCKSIGKKVHEDFHFLKFDVPFYRFVTNVKSFLAFEIVSLQATLPDCGLLIISACLPLLTPIGKKKSE